jgi:site-specific DNA-methyltransferase (adenine-specific)
MEFMKNIPDKYYDLAIVDPPYGINIQKMNYTQNTKGGVAKRKDYSSVGNWDSKTPNKEYFNELFRISKNQIIWGGNYFELPLTKSWIVWDKKTEDKYSNDFADCELAWSSFDKPAKIVRYLWSGMLQPNMKDKQKRIHPTEKPYQLYKWLIDKYAKQGDKIFDSHLGSASSAIAAHDYGFELDGCELDPEYFEKGIQRVKSHISQLKLF